MHYFGFILKSAVEDLGRSKLRTFLTSLGILIGISSVVLLSAMGLGLKKYIEDQFRDLGANLIIVMPGKGLKDGMNASSMLGGIRFDEKDAATLKRYNQDDFSVSDQKEMMDMLSSIFNVLNMVLVAVSAISLIVGGVGIMNIMYVSVVERINEIGVRRAVGALDHDILFLFLSESVILSLIGGVFGLIFSYTVVVLIAPIFPAYINFQAIVLAIGVSFTIGIFFGVFPARKAAKLTPIEAINHE